MRTSRQEEQSYERFRSRQLREVVDRLYQREGRLPVVRLAVRRLKRGGKWEAGVILDRLERILTADAYAEGLLSGTAGVAEAIRCAARVARGDSVCADEPETVALVLDVLDHDSDEPPGYGHRPN